MGTHQSVSMAALAIGLLSSLFCSSNYPQHCLITLNQVQWLVPVYQIKAAFYSHSVLLFSSEWAADSLHANHTLHLKDHNARTTVHSCFFSPFSFCYASLFPLWVGTPLSEI